MFVFVTGGLDNFGQAHVNSLFSFTGGLDNLGQLLNA